MNAVDKTNKLNHTMNIPFLPCPRWRMSVKTWKTKRLKKGETIYQVNYLEILI